MVVASSGLAVLQLDVVVTWVGVVLLVEEGETVEDGVALVLLEVVGVEDDFLVVLLGVVAIEDGLLLVLLDVWAGDKVEDELIRIVGLVL